MVAPPSIYSPSYTPPPPYLSSYGRPLSSSYSNPIPSRSHHFTSSRYTPMLSTISETTPPFSSVAGRYSGISALTRINSPKLTLHSSPKYIAPRPIPINTADIDVSASRYNSHHAVTRPSTSSGYSSKSRSRSPDETETLMPRCDQDDTPNETNRPIKRDRTVVRISTLRNRSKSGSKEKDKRNKGSSSDKSTPVIKVTEPPDRDNGIKRTWRDNFGEDLVMKLAKDQPRKSPGELLLERHLIKSDNDNTKKDPSTEIINNFTANLAVFQNDESCKNNEESPDDDDDTDELLEDACLQNARSSSTGGGLRRPSFHDICQDISSDKLDSVDDLNAGELRRRASLVDQMEEFEDQQHQGQDCKDTPPIFECETTTGRRNSVENNFSALAVNKVTKSASGTLHCILERHLHNDGDSPSNSHTGGPKSAKKFKQKITAKVFVDEPKKNILRASILHLDEVDEEAEMKPVPKSKLSVSVEHVGEEHHVVDHVFTLPKTKKSVEKSAKPKPIVRKRSSKKEKSSTDSSSDSVDDFWGAIGGTRETVYISRRRQELMAKQLKMLSSVTEVFEEMHGIDEVCPSEMPQSPVLEHFAAKELKQEEEPMKQVQILKKPELLTGKQQTNSVKTSEVGARDHGLKYDQSKPESEKCENITGPKITTTTTTGTGAKSPETSRRRKLISGKEEEKKTTEATTSAPVLGKWKKKASSDAPPKSCNASETEGGSTSSSSASLQGPKITAVKNTERKPKITEEVVKTKSSCSTTSSGGESVEKIFSNDVTIKSTNTTTDSDRVEAVSEHVAKKPSPSTTYTKKTAQSKEMQIKTATTTSNKSKVDNEMRKPNGNPTTATNTNNSSSGSSSGNLSKFPTFGNLNQLSLVDIDQSASEMAIEISVDTSLLQDPAAPPSSVSASSSNNSKKEIEIVESVVVEETVSKVTGAVEVDGAKTVNSVDTKEVHTPPSTSSVSPPPVSVIKKKKIVIKKVKKKSPAKTPEQTSSSETTKKSPSPNVDDSGNVVAGEEVAVGSEELPVEEHKETIQELIRRVHGTNGKKEKFNPQRNMKFSPDYKKKLFTVDEKATKILWATPRPLQKPKKVVYYSSDEDSSENSDEDSEETSEESSETASETDEFFPCPNPMDAICLYSNKDEVRMSTCSNDSGFEGGTAPSSPKNMLGKRV